MTLSWISSRGGFLWRRKYVVLKIKLTIVEYRREKHWHLYMTVLFTRRRDIASCPWFKQSHLGKFSNTKLRISRTSTLVNHRTYRSTADFTSAFSNVNNVKISDLLAFLVMLLFSSLCSHLKIICDGGAHFWKVARLWKHAWGRFFFDNLKNLWQKFLSIFTCNLNGYFPMKLPPLRKCNKPVPKQVKQETLRVVTTAMICSNLAWLWKFKYFRRPIYNPLEHLWWRFYYGNSKSLCIFTKKLHHRCLLGS